MIRTAGVGVVGLAIDFSKLRDFHIRAPCLCNGFDIRLEVVGRGLAAAKNPVA
jgi:hypothetical protein